MTLGGNIIKKIIEFILCLVIIIMIVGCSKKNDEVIETPKYDTTTSYGNFSNVGLSLNRIYPRKSKSNSTINSSDMIFYVYESLDGDFETYKSDIYETLKEIADDAKVYNSNGSEIDSPENKMSYDYRGLRVNVELLEVTGAYEIIINY